jgi:hypothetical protein
MYLIYFYLFMCFIICIATICISRLFLKYDVIKEKGQRFIMKTHA